MVILNKDPDKKGIAPPTFVAQRCINDAGMLSKWKVNFLDSKYHEIKPKVSRKK